MTEAENIAPSARISKRARLILQMIVGAAFGGTVTYGTLMLLEGRVPLLDDPQRLAALAVGLTFAMMGLFVLLGTAVPRPGSVLLNVEDEEELRERSPDLRNSGLISALTGAVLLTLSLTATDTSTGLMSKTAGSVVLAIGLVAITIAGFAMRNMGDELDKTLSTEASALAMHASLILFGGWGILSYLGHAPWIGPLGLLSGMTAMYLVAVMWVVGRRGLMTR